MVTGAWLPASASLHFLSLSTEVPFPILPWGQVAAPGRGLIKESTMEKNLGAPGP